MANKNNWLAQNDGAILGKETEMHEEGVLVKNFLERVYTYMTAALAISGITAWWFGTSPALMNYLITPEGGNTMLGWVVMLAPLGLVLLMGFGIKRLSSTAMLGVFLLFSLLMGMSLSYIFIAYSSASITTTFFVTAGTFAIMSVVGYTTQTDLSKFGSILMMALVGIIIAMVVNWFLQSSTLDYIISGIGVLVFTGLTAYDTQKLKRIGTVVDAESEEGSKLALMGSLSLYLDFVNLFLFLLRFLGGGRD